MAEILKFVYIVILFISILLVVETEQCVYDADCEKIYPLHRQHLFKCIKAFCVRLDQVEEVHVAKDGVFPSTVHAADATGVDAKGRKDLS
ncbi:putative Late nodulin [Medicago truncatula]|uniref:Putative Late nodulin n=1 Tax=Medicago truncatula TaxID=3880 RepID=A0A396I8M6_MEDTR|nr:putative Late nodulin [Medicago truncatula]